RRPQRRPRRGGQPGVHVVGLPRRQLPQEPGPADRPRAARPAHGRADRRGLDRPRLPQGRDAVRSRAARDRPAPDDLTTWLRARRPADAECGTTSPHGAWLRTPGATRPECAATWITPPRSRTRTARSTRPAAPAAA